MPTGHLELLGFTILPLVTLVIGILLAVGYVVASRDRRVLLGALLFGLMASHQTVELVQWIGGVDPYRSRLGELFETSVNLLAVAAIGYIVLGLAEERRVSEAHESLQRSLLNGRPGTTTAPGRGESPPGGTGLRDRLGALGSMVSSAPGILAFGRRSRLDTVLDRAVADARITFPIATFDVRSPDGVDVVADETYLEEVFEIVLERLVLYNDASDPNVKIRVVRADGGVEVRFDHNGSGLPDSVRRLLESGTDAPDPETAELVFVETFVSRWGGSIRVDDDSSITMRFVRPRLPRLFG